MQDPLDKIRKLLALSTSSFPEEARSAALLAAQLINEYKVVLSMPAANGSGYARTTGPTEWWGTPKPKPQSAPYARPRSNDTPIFITVQHPSPCKVCKKRIERGEEAWWEPKIGLTHEECSVPF